MEEVNERLEEFVKIESEKLGLTKEVKEEVRVEKETDPYLEEAVKQGYNPDYKGANKKTPEQFVKDGTFFKKIEAQNKKIDELIEFNRQAMEHAKKVEQAAYEKAVKDLQLAKLEAIKEADVQKVMAIEQEVAAKEELRKLPAKEVTPEPTKDEIEFREKNASWINGTSKEDLAMQARAQATIIYLQKTAPDSSAKEAIAKITEDLKREFPHKFGNENQKNAELITKSTTSKESSDSSELASRLTKDQRSYFKKAKLYGSNLTLEQYAEQLDLIGDLRDE